MIIICLPGIKNLSNSIYPKMQTMMDYCLSRRNKNGLIEGLSGDWTFIDWAAGLSKKGEISFEQMLFARSLEAMSLCADIVNDKSNSTYYKKLAADLKTKLFSLYWNNQKQALVHSRVNGKQTDNVTRFANMFGIFFNYFTEAQKQQVKKSVLLNDNIQKITTAYMRFYELEALSAAMHAAYWHNNFGVPRSHGCVNCQPEDAKWIFRWATPANSLTEGDIVSEGLTNGTHVIVQELTV